MQFHVVSLVLSWWFHGDSMVLSRGFYGGVCVSIVCHGSSMGFSWIPVVLP